MANPNYEFVTSYLKALAERVARRSFSPAQTEQIMEIGRTLVARGNHELPNSDEGLASFALATFAYTCAIFEGQIDPTIYVGGRHEGFEDRFTAAKAKYDTFNSRKRRPKLPTQEVTTMQKRPKLTLVSTTKAARVRRPNGKKARKQRAAS